ncbi:hypothetical protein B0H14DRAFT_2572561 [Mycena olivaceomarginata]|nr:hypothetical protein B0H14DRAFT_2572561 [Mycena olivaceomarginata]
MRAIIGGVRWRQIGASRGVKGASKGGSGGSTGRQRGVTGGVTFEGGEWQSKCGGRQFICDKVSMDSGSNMTGRHRTIVQSPVHYIMFNSRGHPQCGGNGQRRRQMHLPHSSIRAELTFQLSVVQNAHQAQVSRCIA